MKIPIYISVEDETHCKHDCPFRDYIVEQATCLLFKQKIKITYDGTLRCADCCLNFKVDSQF